MFFDRVHYSKTMQMDKKFRFPLGGDLYAYVNTRRRDGVKIHIRHFQLSTDTKGGVKPTTRGVKMDAKTLRRLVAIKKPLMDEFKLCLNEDQKSSEQQKTCEKQKKLKRKELRLELPETAPLLRPQAETCEKQKKLKRKELRLELPETPPLLMPEQEIRQQISWPLHLNENNYPAAFVDVGALTPSYSYNDP